MGQGAELLANVLGDFHAFIKITAQPGAWQAPPPPRSADIPVRSSVRRLTRFGKRSGRTCIWGLLRTGMSALRSTGGFEMRPRSAVNREWSCARADYVMPPGLSLTS